MTIPLSVRFEILQRDGFRCQFCGKQVPETELEVDHLEPRSKGGSDDAENLVSACRDCNRGKGDKPANLWARSWRSLDGKFFHSYGKDRTAKWQGRILSEVQPGFFVIELHEWLTGSASFTGIRVVALETMAAEGWSFYLSVEEMADAYKYGGIARQV